MTRKILNVPDSTAIAISLAIFILSLFLSIALVYASDETQFSQSISGTLDVKIVDAEGNEVSNPSVVFPSKAFSPIYQTSDATLGTSSQKMRVINPSNSTAAWTLSIAASSGSTAVWSNGVGAYDFNDSTPDAGDGSDADSVGGQMSIDPSMGTIVGVSGTSTSNVSKGSADAFVEGSTDSIDLMSASSSAQKPGVWDLTGVSVSQTIPAMQGTGAYVINMTLTAS